MTTTIKSLEKAIEEQYQLLYKTKCEAEWWNITSKINNLSVDLSNARKRVMNRNHSEYLPEFSLSNQLL